MPQDGLAPVHRVVRAVAGHPGRLAVIGIYGILTQHATPLEAFGLSTSCDTIARQLRTAMVDPGVDRVVLDIDSQGGSGFGLSELAAEIRNARGTKPIVAVANSMAASAAYWLAASCSEVFVAPSGVVGSIGMVAAHEDIGGALALAGINVTLVFAGKHKADGNPYGPLGREARDAMQADVDSYGRDFLRDVAAGRRVSIDHVRRDFGEGRMLRGDAAAKVGMADGVATLDDVLRGTARPRSARLDASTLARMPAALANAMRTLELLN